MGGAEIGGGVNIFISDSYWDGECVFLVKVT